MDRRTPLTRHQAVLLLQIFLLCGCQKPADAPEKSPTSPPTAAPKLEHIAPEQPKRSELTREFSGLELGMSMAKAKQMFSDWEPYDSFGVGSHHAFEMDDEFYFFVKALDARIPAKYLQHSPKEGDQFRSRYLTFVNGSLVGVFGIYNGEIGKKIPFQDFAAKAERKFGPVLSTKTSTFSDSIRTVAVWRDDRTAILLLQYKWLLANEYFFIAYDRDILRAIEQKQAKEAGESLKKVQF